MKAINAALQVMLGFGLLAGSGCGRSSTPLSPTAIAEAARFYGGNTQFSAVEFSSLHDSKIPNQTAIRTNVTKKALAFSDGKQRTDIFGGDTIMLTTIVRPDRSTRLTVWPRSKVMAEESLNSPKSGASPGMKHVTDKREIGTETIDGHPCVKCNVVVQDRLGTAEWTTWEATDLNRFPVRAESLNDTNIVRLEYRDIKLVKPDDSVFEPPKGYKRFKSLEMAVMYQIKQSLKQLEAQPQR